VTTVAILLGFLAGAFSGLFGVGGGVIFVPALTLFLSQSQVGAEATSLLAIVPVALVGAWRQHGYGNVRVKDGIVVGVLSALGVLGGVALANELPEHTLRVVFAVVMLLTAVQLVRRALRSPPDGAPAD